MPTIKVKLLADVNKDLRGNASATLQPKFIALVSAAELNLYLRYDRRTRRGKHTFTVNSQSHLQIDDDIQRGSTTTGELCQEDSKIEEIAKSLVGKSVENPRVFLGTLVWNIREQGLTVFKTITTLCPGDPPAFELEINCPAIWLTDSAHRHFGICEAVRRHGELGAESKFDPAFEFPIEIYNVDKHHESMLFRELNSKQKKITAAKQQQVDNTSALGRLKEAIRTYDAENEGFFVDNIEVNANLNDRQTLMTMSVFVAAIKEMFGKSAIEQSAQNEGNRTLMAEYFTNSFYALRDRIRVKCTILGTETEVSPFTNLHSEIIRPVENSLADEDDEERGERHLNAAREEAYARNKAVMQEDKLNSNPFIKALAHTLGRVRGMNDPFQIIDVIQSKLITPHNGRYFQKGNPRMTAASGDSRPAIATNKDDGTLNVQVTTQTINEIKKLFTDELQLIFPAQLLVVDSTGSKHPLNESPSSYMQVLKRTSETNFTIVAEFDVGDSITPERIDCKLSIKADMTDGGPWAKSIKRIGENQLPANECKRIDGYAHPIFGNSVARYQATYSVEFPPFSPISTTSFSLKVEATVLNERGDEATVKAVLTCQAE